MFCAKLIKENAALWATVQAWRRVRAAAEHRRIGGLRRVRARSAWAKSALTSLRSLRKLDFVAPSPPFSSTAGDFAHPCISANHYDGTRSVRNGPARVATRTGPAIVGSLPTEAHRG